MLTPPGTLPDVAAAVDGVVKETAHVRLDPPPPPRALAQEQRAWFLATIDTMHEADALVAEVSGANASAAWAIAWLLARGRLVILLCSREQREKLSPIYAGNPSPWQRILVYDGANDLRTQLSALLAP